MGVNGVMLMVQKYSGPLFSAGHTACAGCPMPTIIRAVLNATGPDVVVVNATSCSEIISSAYPRSAWGVPYIHSLFENAPAVATGGRGWCEDPVRARRIRSLRAAAG